MDLHIDDFHKDAAKGLLMLYMAFPKKSTLYIDDLIGYLAPDELGLPSDRQQRCLSTFLWLAEEGYLRYQSINDLVLPNGRLLEQRNRTWELLNDIPGVSCVKPMGALYAFPKIDPKVFPIHNDEKFVLDLLLSEKLLVVQGTAFNWPWPDHFRVVTLPRVDDLEQAIGRIGNFLKTYRQ